MKPGAQFLKFASAGAIGTALHYAVLILWVAGLGNDPALGAMVGASCGAVCNYLLNHRYTFRSDRPHKEALPRFLFMASIGILLNGVIVKALTLVAVDYLLSQVGATLIILVMNFLLSKLWIFKRSR